jgi:hypothetical protein
MEAPGKLMASFWQGAYDCDAQLLSYGLLYHRLSHRLALTGIAYQSRPDW